MFYLIITLLFVAGICKSIMNITQFHFNNSIFSTFKNQKWFNPSISWKNKWKNGDPKQGEKFLGSSNIFVWVTDAWHFFQRMMQICMILSIVLYLPMFGLIYDFFIFYTVYTLTFEVFYSKIWTVN